jgi:formylglycine-generating enzyme
MKAYMHAVLMLLLLTTACDKRSSSGSVPTSFTGETPPETASPGDTWVNPTDGSVLVYVPVGTFEMGSSDSDACPDERPPHAVYVDAFWIGKYPITIEQFARFVSSTGYKTDGQRQTPSYEWRSGDGRPDNPVGGVSWNDAAAYCQWAGVRLPTEAEWEKAARGTDRRTYPWGNTRDERKFMTQSQRNIGPRSIAAPQVQVFPVTAFDKEGAASPYGVFCMASHYRNWCLDYYDEGLYGRRHGKSVRNPVAPNETGQGVLVHEVVVGQRVLRGGFGVRSSSRTYWTQNQAYWENGFRVALGYGVGAPAVDQRETILQLSDRVALHDYFVPVALRSNGKIILEPTIRTPAGVQYRKMGEVTDWATLTVKAQEAVAIGEYRKALDLIRKAEEPPEPTGLVHYVHGDTYYFMALLYLLQKNQFTIDDSRSVTFRVDSTGSDLLSAAMAEYAKAKETTGLRLELTVGENYVVPPVSVGHEHAIQQYRNSGDAGLRVDNRTEIGLLSAMISQLFGDDSLPMNRLRQLGIVK